MDNRALLRATFVGTILQLAMVVAGHFIPYIRTNFFMFGGMMISAIAGYLYGADTGRGYFTSATAGAIAGGVCAFIGICVSVLLRDTPQFIIAMGTAISVLTGAIGGLFGQMAANMKRMR